MLVQVSTVGISVLVRVAQQKRGSYVHTIVGFVVNLHLTS